MNISVVGTGYVGLVTGTCFAEFGLHVTCIDKESSKIKKLKKGEMPIYEPGLEELVRKNMREGRLEFTTDLSEAIHGALVVFIAVGTPSKKDGTADLSYVDEVARQIAHNMDGYKVVVTKSTVPVGTGERIRKIIEKEQKAPCNFDIVSNPEFLREGSAVNDFMRPDRVVIGANSDQAVAIMKDLYKPLYLIETPIVITNVETSEMIKYASNAFLATKVSFINEIADLCELTGADVHQVAKGMGLDGRIGPKFLHPGPGYGGSCFPKDTRAITHIAREHDHVMEIIEAVIKVNEDRKKKMAVKIIKHMGGDVAGTTIGFLGLAFKPNTDDMRESPSLTIIEVLQKQGAKIRAYDPAAMEEAAKVLKDVEYFSDPYDVAEGCDALVLITEWPQFRNLDLDELKRRLKAPVVVDLRNIYETARMKEKGIRYTSIGRPS
ncbi:MAG TPA: UDP-glucose/GDP-mannose dehydrogenase family protein [Acidobacteriota bacterium]|nr:UDP-glucose/GDP-mannose dehydrogenase family protein [Acidobacteriota bacterium]